MEVRVLGLREALRELRSLGEGNVLREACAETVDRCADRVLESAKALVPVETGALRDSLKKRHKKGSLVAKVFADYPDTGEYRKKKTNKQAAGSPVYYAFAVEYGTKGTKTRRARRAKPFLYPAARANIAAGDRDMEEAIERVLSRGGR
ncbi:MAG TPA: HK97 gp10 family phage protein [Synergistaceae bacterium]|nr:HK97 gp10 family phage protein [Synergistaceae bacterium]